MCVGSVCVDVCVDVCGCVVGGCEHFTCLSYIT